MSSVVGMELLDRNAGSGWIGREASSVAALLGGSEVLSTCSSGIICGRKVGVRSTQYSLVTALLQLYFGQR